MKTDAVYKRAFNRLAAMLSTEAFGTTLPPENDLRRRLGVSRTTVRKVLDELARRSVVVRSNGARVLVRQLEPGDFYPEAETTPRAKHVEEQFMEWMLRGDTRPGTLINTLELARQFGVAANPVREFLIRFSRFGLIEKRPNSGWLFKGFTEEFALELFEIRVMFELRSARLFGTQPPGSPLWSQLQAIRSQHVELLAQIDERFHDFSALDNQFHRLVNRVASNRFIDDFYEIIALVFHYHYQWNKQDEKTRNRDAIVEHLAYIDALFSRDDVRIQTACLEHLSSAKGTLIRSLIGISPSDLAPRARTERARHGTTATARRY